MGRRPPGVRSCRWGGYAPLRRLRCQGCHPQDSVLPELERAPPTKALQLTAKGLVPIGLWYRLAPNASAPFRLGSGPLSAAERHVRCAASMKLRTCAAVLIATALIQTGCFTPRAALDIVRSSSVVSITATPRSSRTVDLAIVYGHLDRGSDAFLGYLFHPISTESDIRMEVPRRCPTDRLYIQATQGHALKLTRFCGVEILYWHIGSRGDLLRLEGAGWFGDGFGGSRSPPKVDETACVLWFRLLEEPKARPGDLVISYGSGQHLLRRSLPPERPWLRPKRWAWLLVSPIVDVTLPILALINATFD